MRPVLDDIASAGLALVVTWSSGGLAAQRGYSDLKRAGEQLFSAHAHTRIGPVRALLIGKGSRCNAHMPMLVHVLSGNAHCIAGPNVGARESHTIWQYCLDFYRHLPRVTLFTQDDPGYGLLHGILHTHQDFAKALEATYTARANSGLVHDQRHLGRSVDKRQPRPLASYTPWAPDPCACTTVTESFSTTTYGGYRPMHWWMRTFLAPFANASVELPATIKWPRAAQFAVPRAAIRRRSRDFYMYHVRLTEVAAPLKSKVPRRAGTSDKDHTRTAKWANFGPMIVDLGPRPRGGYADGRPGINGMDMAQCFERSWFQVFDPSLTEAQPTLPQCYERAAIQQSPMRCMGAACPASSYRNQPAAVEAAWREWMGGCAATDARGETAAPPRWPFSSLSKSDTEWERRCLGAGCLVKETLTQPLVGTAHHTAGSGTGSAWARRS